MKRKAECSVAVKIGVVLAVLRGTRICSIKRFHGHRDLRFTKTSMPEPSRISVFVNLIS